MARANRWVTSNGWQGHAEQAAPQVGTALHGPLQRFDLGTVVGRSTEEGAWQRVQRSSSTLRKGWSMNVVLLVMKAGDRLEEHAAPGPLSLSVRERRIRFAAGEEVVEAESGTLLNCGAGVRHSVDALSDAVCLLTIAG